jgi:hypothetical protein
LTILTEESLEFAKEHISRFYDTDFYPKPFEYDAIWHCWPDVKKELTSKNVDKMSLAPPRALPWKKPKSGYRIVHQLEPLESIIYTALAFQISSQVELSRVPQEFGVACAYRIDISDGSFFSSGSGYDQFREFSKDIASKKGFVLLTDIADFYNQIYLHRLNNAIEHASNSLKKIADDIEGFLTRLNDKASQGVPVGPAASIIMAEATLNDVDQYLIDLKVEHTRYVDDFRIFSESKDELETVLQKLTLYLYKNHRLSLSTEKTSIIPSKDFISKLENPYEIEKIEVIEEIEVLDPYNSDIVEFLYVEDEEKTHKLVIEKITDAFNSLVTRSPIDLGYTRALIRQARARRVDEILPIITKNFDFFLPVMNNIALYLNDVTKEGNIVFLSDFFKKWILTNPYGNELPRLWIEWYLTKHSSFMNDKTISNFLLSSPNYITQARTAIHLKKLSWIRDKKSLMLTSGSWERRAILYASQILPSDERNHWLKQVESETPYFLDKLICKWLLSKARTHSFDDFDDDIPF